MDDIYDFGLTEGNQQVNGFINLPMTAFYYFAHQDPFNTDPPMGDPEGATQFYNFMQGKIGITGEYFINPVTGLPTTFALSGNPVTGEGWIDGILQGPGDRRLGLSTGPFQMAPGDTQIVVIAEIAAGAIDGVTRMMAIETLKHYSALAQKFYDNAFTGTLHVPANYATIQEAIDAAIDGNVVLVADGTYLENINFKGKAITVASHFLIDGNESHIENTIIDGSQPVNPNDGSVVSFVSGEDTTSVLCGFTVTRGTGNYDPIFGVRGAGGIAVYFSGAKICNNIIEYNSVTHSADALGGGIQVYSAGYIVIIKNNIIRNNSLNSPYPFGGGISLYDNGLTYILSNEIINNEIIGAYAKGGGIDVNGSLDQVIIKNNYIKGNIAPLYGGNGGGGIRLYNWGAPVTISNNLIVDNSGYKGGGVLVDYDVDVSSKTTTLNVGNLSRTKKDSKSSKFLQDIPVLVNNTIIDNSAEIGGGIHCEGYSPVVMNSIVWKNTYTTGGQISGTATVVYSDVEGGYPGEGNIDTNPSFSDTLFHLADSSLCIGAGIESIDIGGTMYYCPPFCYHGSPRPNPTGSKPDIGACESPLPNPVGVEDDLSIIPEEYSLAQNYPNPFNPTTTIVYGLKERTILELKVYDVLGREIETIVDGEQNAGFYEIEFNANRLASGIYFYRIQAGSFVETKKMLLLK